MDAELKVQKAIEIIEDCGWIDGGHHKMWVIDQVLRILRDDYDEWVKNYPVGEDGPQTYGEWDTGIAP